MIHETVLVRAERELAEKEYFMHHLRIVDCEKCRRRTMPSERFPTGLCMAYNQAPAYVYEQCLKSGVFVPKTRQTQSDFSEL